MKVLIVIRGSRAKRYLVDLPTKRLILDVKKLIAKNKHFQAMVLAFTKGRFEKEISDVEQSHIKTKLILREESVSWDL